MAACLRIPTAAAVVSPPRHAVETPRRQSCAAAVPPLPTFLGLRQGGPAQRGADAAALLRPTSAAAIAARTGALTVRAAQAVEIKPHVEQGQVKDMVNAIRMLIVDSVNAAKAGHPGGAMGMAEIGYLLFDETMRFNPANPAWFDRDRFMLSNGHCGLLQYSLLHLTGYPGVEIEDLKQVTKFGSKTPGHPENTHMEGIEVTTGPLGQGFANAVGMALAEKHLAARFNKPEATLVDHYTFVTFGDGCAMEGVTNEAASLAGHWGLGKLIAFYDDNSVTIDGYTDITFRENVRARYDALGWHTQHVVNPHENLDELRNAIKEAKSVTDKPSFIQVTTIIGYGSPKLQGTPKAHHGAFGEEERENIRQKLGWESTEPFHIPEAVYREYHKAGERGAEAEKAWQQELKQYEEKYPEDAKAFHQLISKELPAGWEKALPTWSATDEADATRGYSETVLNALADVIPGLVGGSADLASSNKAYLKKYGDFEHDTPANRNFRYGIREHAMGSISNGLALHNTGLIPFAATFMVFTDYMRAPIRLSALSEAQVIWICTHDSIGVGEDGPTHQPVEHLASLRAIPNLRVIRPGSGNEVSGAYMAALHTKDRPTLIALSRQKMESHVEGATAEGVLKGGYVISDNSGEGANLDLILIATGAELLLAAKAAEEIRKEGKNVRVVSLVCWELFEEQPEEYREQVLPPAVTARLSVEAGSPQGWREWIGPKGQTLSVSTFGKSGSYKDVFKAYGYTVENVVERAKGVMASQGASN